MVVFGTEAKYDLVLTFDEPSIELLLLGTGKSSTPNRRLVHEVYHDYSLFWKDFVPNILIGVNYDIFRD
jgi:hypothetical protein